MLGHARLKTDIRKGYLPEKEGWRITFYEESIGTGIRE
jgi:hypothetical protein